MQATRPLHKDALWERKLCSLWLRSPGRANGTETLMSSDCNSFPSVCLVKKRQRLGGLELTTLRGLELFALCAFFFFFPPALMCSCYSILPPLTSCQRERERDTHTHRKDRERKGKRASLRGKGRKEVGGSKHNHSTPAARWREKVCAGERERGGGGAEIGG